MGCGSPQAGAKRLMAWSSSVSRTTASAWGNVGVGPASSRATAFVSPHPRKSSSRPSSSTTRNDPGAIAGASFSLAETAPVRAPPAVGWSPALSPSAEALPVVALPFAPPPDNGTKGQSLCPIVVSAGTLPLREIGLCPSMLSFPAVPKVNDERGWFSGFVVAVGLPPPHVFLFDSLVANGAKGLSPCPIFASMAKWSLTWAIASSEMAQASCAAFACSPCANGWSPSARSRRRANTMRSPCGTARCRCRASRSALRRRTRACHRVAPRRAAPTDQAR